jgi:hypothetical protein
MTMTKYQRAAQVWPLLAFAARNRQILTYGLIGKLTGLPAQGVGQQLGPIQSFCFLNKLPGLTSLVVHETDGLPGKGFTAVELERVFGEQARVFSFDWLSLGPPSPEQLENAHKNKASVAGSC